MTWYLRSLDDHDAHRGTMRGGAVIAECGVRFSPRPLRFGHPGQPDPPGDPDQACVQCRRTVAGPPVSVPVRWALSVLDMRWHTVDERRNHPSGVWVTDCGHRVLSSTDLHDGPGGRACDGCASMQLARALPSPRSNRDPDPRWWAFSVDDGRAHVLEPVDGAPPGVLTSRCGRELPPAAMPNDRPIPTTLACGDCARGG